MSHHRPGIEKSNIEPIGDQNKQNQDVRTDKNSPSEDRMDDEGDLIEAESGSYYGRVDNEGPGYCKPSLMNIFLVVGSS